MGAALHFLLLGMTLAHPKETLKDFTALALAIPPRIKPANCIMVLLAGVQVADMRLRIQLVQLEKLSLGLLRWHH
jgi:hypothetical protein